MIKTEEILIKGSRAAGRTRGEIFTYEPENIEESALGNLYVVAEIQSEKDSCSQLVNLLSSLIKREYYSLPHRGPTASLEAGLKKANQTLSEMSAQGNLEWLGKLHFICAVLNKEKELFLTQTGQAKAFVCREGNLTDITKKIIPPPQKPHPAKTFQSVISGQIEATDKIFFLTPGFFNFVNEAGIEQILTLPKIEAVSEQIKKILREQKKLPSLYALFLEICPEKNCQENLSQREFVTPPIGLEEIFR